MKDPKGLRFSVADKEGVLISRAYYDAPVTDFLSHDPAYILGELSMHHEFDIDELQRNAWLEQINILKRSVASLAPCHILFEYAIPRMGKRVDVVLLTHDIVIVLEFKVGEGRYPSEALDQALDYALDLKNFHEQSHDRPIIPILVATEGDAEPNMVSYFEGKVYSPLKANKANLGGILREVIKYGSDSHFDPLVWRDSHYKPTPTIIQAAQALYRGHDVKEISRSDASAINLSTTAEAISEAISWAKTKNQKAICFITGVPGAGKTLAGLNLANERLRTDEDEHAVFLSGNGPLVKVLREALVRGETATTRNGSAKRMTRKSATAKVHAFIQNIHHFRDDALASASSPLERVVVFDEAQRAWTLEQTASFMKRKKHIADFSMSEPQFLISVMDRHSDWAVIVCLIGGGQEINTGEAGLLEWFSALKNHFPNWRVYLAPNLTDDEYTRGRQISAYLNDERLRFDRRLHLAVSLRSYRAERVSRLVKAVLDNNFEEACALRSSVNEKYPILVTRDIEKARNWLRAQARGTERYGLLASSGAMRLRPTGINVQADVDVVNWFLNSKNDIRSSYFLEEVATEFDVQGLELDWTCIAWDADFRYQDGKWEFWSFRGTRWQKVKDVTRQWFLKNAYRVLLTRARQGMVILVPCGDANDETRRPTYYDETFAYLKHLGFEEL